MTRREFIQKLLLTVMALRFCGVEAAQREFEADTAVPEETETGWEVPWGIPWEVGGSTIERTYFPIVTK